MTLLIKHLFTSLKSDGIDNSLVQPGDWNDNHVITLAAFSLVGRGSGAGAAQEIPFDAIGLPVGAMTPFAGASPPSQYLLCYGQAISRSTYSVLFTAIGTVYGVGDGSTTFNVPDLRGRSVFGRDDMGGVASNRLTGLVMVPNGNTLGAVGGAQLHVLDTTQIPAHNHAVTDPGHVHAYVGGPLGLGGAGAGDVLQAAASGLTNSQVTGISIQNTGGGGAHNNTPPAMIANWIIKALPV